MTSQLLDRILTKYPDWHKQPLRLSLEEINDPQLVLQEFFSCYHLTATRDCLKEWLTEAIRPGQRVTMDFIHLHHHVEKLIEAAWLLHTAKPKKKKKKHK